VNPSFERAGRGERKREKERERERKREIGKIQQTPKE